MPPEMNQPGMGQQGSFAGGGMQPAPAPQQMGSFAGTPPQQGMGQGGDVEAQIRQMVAQMPEEKLMEIIQNMHDRDYLMNLVNQMSGGNQEDMEFAVDALELLIEAVSDFAMDKYNKTLGMMNPNLKEQAVQASAQPQEMGPQPPQQGSFAGGGA